MLFIVLGALISGIIILVLSLFPSLKLIVSSEESCGQSIDGITVSIGVSCEIDEIDDVNKLIECADKALYQAKEEGRNRVVVYDSTHA
jgi:diguanylate cyclase (GGDEF)-like protein